MKIIKFICLLLICLATLNHVSAVKVGMLGKMSMGMLSRLTNALEKSRSKNKNNNKSTYKSKSEVENLITKAASNPSDANDEVADMQVYFQGWIKFLNYKDDAPTSQGKKLKNFFKNDLYELQMKSGKSSEEVLKKDNNGNFINIPSDLHFYAILYKNQLAMFSSRDDAVQKSVDVLNLDNINPIPEEDHFAGGVKDFGSFSEGHCIRVLTKEPLEKFTMSAEKYEPSAAVNKKWILCFDENEKKKTVMNLLINLKLKKQHKLGIYIELDKSGEIKDEAMAALNKVESAGQPSKPNNNIDGYWIMLQDWSDCTLSCGGGLQYQQLMCVPPKEGGKPCQGPAIRSRPCKTQPCPVAESKSLGLKASNEQVTAADGTPAKQLPPIMKTMSISKRKNRYDKCVIKEDDAIMAKIDDSTTNFSAAPKVPVRIILNERVISIFQDDNLENMLVSFTIKDTAFMRLHDQPRCFILKKTSGEAQELCQLDSSNGTGSWVDEWDYDYNLFKFQCHKKRSKSDVAIEVEEEKKLKEEFNEKVNQAKMEVVQERKAEVAEEAQEQEEIASEKTVDKAKETSLQAMKKEINLEQLLETEEKAREDRETEEIQMQIDQEEKKTECLARAIKEKQLEDHYNVVKSRAQQNISHIAENTKNAIAEKRNEIKKKIAEMRKKQERKKRMMKNQLMSIRSVMVQQMTQAAKVGDMSKCKNPSQEGDEEVTKYCQFNFSTDFSKYTECITPASFCYVCCENEFGELHILERDKCYYHCDSNKLAPPEQASESPAAAGQ